MKLTTQSPARPIMALLVMALAGCLLWNSATAADAPVSFKGQIAPILLDKCLTCHNAEKAKGKYRLHTFAALLKSGSSGEPAVTPGNPAASELYRLLLEKDPENRMPQNADPLTKGEIQLIERWIKQGATFDSEDKSLPLASLIPKSALPSAPKVYPFAVPVSGLAFVNGGTELAVSGYHEVTLWSSTNGALVRRIGGLEQQVRRLSAHPKLALLAAATGSPGRRGDVVLIDLEGKQEPRTLVRSSDVFLDVAFSPDGTQLLAGGSDNSIRLFDVASGKELLKLDQHADWVTAVTWSMDGKQFATASRDKTARTFSAPKGELESTYTGHDSALFAIAFNADGTSVISAGRDKTAHLWNAADGKKAGQMSGFEGDAYQLLVDEKTLYLAASQTKLMEFSLSGRSLTRSYAGPRNWIYSIALEKASQRLAAGTHDGMVYVWKLGSTEPILSFATSPGLTTAKNLPLKQ